MGWVQNKPPPEAIRRALLRTGVIHRGVRQGLAGEGGYATVATTRGTMSQSARYLPSKPTSCYPLGPRTIPQHFLSTAVL